MKMAEMYDDFKTVERNLSELRKLLVDHYHEITDNELVPFVGEKVSKETIKIDKMVDDYENLLLLIYKSVFDPKSAKDTYLHPRDEMAERFRKMHGKEIPR